MSSRHLFSIRRHQLYQLPGRCVLTWRVESITHFGSLQGNHRMSLGRSQPTDLVRCPNLLMLLQGSPARTALFPSRVLTGPMQPAGAVRFAKNVQRDTIATRLMHFPSPVLLELVPQGGQSLRALLAHQVISQAIRDRVSARSVLRVTSAQVRQSLLCRVPVDLSPLAAALAARHAPMATAVWTLHCHLLCVQMVPTAMAAPPRASTVPPVSAV